MGKLCKVVEEEGASIKVASVRRDINGDVWEAAMNHIPRELRQLLAQARGNAHIEVKVKHLIAALIAADDVIAAANNR